MSHHQGIPLKHSWMEDDSPSSSNKALLFRSEATASTVNGVTKNYNRARIYDGDLNDSLSDNPDEVGKMSLKLYNHFFFKIYLSNIF